MNNKVKSIYTVLERYQKVTEKKIDRKEKKLLVEVASAILFELNTKWQFIKRHSKK